MQTLYILVQLLAIQLSLINDLAVGVGRYKYHYILTTDKATIFVSPFASQHSNKCFFTLVNYTQITFIY